MLSVMKDWSLEVTLLAVAIVLYLVYVYNTKNFDYWLVRGIPYRKPLPILGNFGNVLLFRYSQAENVNDMYKWFKNEPFFGVFQSSAPLLVIRDPELIKRVCIKDFPAFHSRGIPINESRIYRNLFHMEGGKWRSLRSKLTPVFSSGRLRNMFYLLAECSDALVDSIGRRMSATASSGESSAMIDTRDLAMDYTVDVIGSCAFGIQISALTEDSEFRAVARKLSKAGYRHAFWRMFRGAHPKLYKLLNVQIVGADVTDFFTNVVSQIIRKREKTGRKRDDFMDLLMEMREAANDLGTTDHEPLHRTNDASATELDEDFIAAQAFMFFVAGSDTSSNAIGFCLYELAINPEVQERARDDVLVALKKNAGKLSYDAVQDMKYLDCVLLETLRKYPPAAAISRRADQPYKLPGSDLTIPKGMRVLLPVYGIHHDPKYYPDPWAFKPERFDGHEKQTHHTSCTFLPFGEGPRSCIGSRFGLLQSKLGVISFLRDFKVEACDKTDIPIKFSKRTFVLGTDNGIWLKVSKLSEQVPA